MIFALIADIHSNLEALDAVLAHARAHGAQRFVFLGDLVGYGADPVAVIEQVEGLVEAGAIALLGNHDAAAAQLDAGAMNEEAHAAIAWTQTQLTARHVDFLAALPLVVREDDMTWVHASAMEPRTWRYVNDAREARNSLDAAATSYVFCGHVHDPQLYYIDNDKRITGFKPVEGVEIPVLINRSWLTIAGAAGQPRDGMTGARYVLFDHERKRLTFHRVAYDYQRAAAKIRAAQLPERFALLLEGVL